MFFLLLLEESVQVWGVRLREDLHFKKRAACHLLIPLSLACDLWACFGDS